MADVASSKSICEVIDHAGFGDDERVAGTKCGEDFWWCVLDLVCWNDIVEAVDISVIKLVVVKVILFLLPLADVRCSARTYQISVTDLADATHVFETEDVGVHGGYEKTRVVGAAKADVTHAQKDVGSDLQSAGGARKGCCAAARGGGGDELHDSSDHVWLACARCPCRGEVDVVVDADHLSISNGNTSDRSWRFCGGSGGGRGIEKGLLLLCLLEAGLGGSQAGSSKSGGHDGAGLSRGG